DAFDLILIEQPLPEDDILGHAELAKHIRTPVCLDESIISARSAADATARGACSIVNIKAWRVAGYLEARRIHHACVAHGVPAGFLDPRSHSDMVPLMDDPQPFKLLQGVTTEIVGNCGYSFAPLTPESAEEAALSFGDLAAGSEILAGSFGDFLERIEKAG